MSVTGLVILLLVVVAVLPVLLDGPTRSRRRRGIDVWDEAWARGEITAEQLGRLRKMERGAQSPATEGERAYARRWGLDIRDRPFDEEVSR